MGDPLKGKSAIVTGAGRGIGRAIAMALAQEGASVVVNDFGVKVDGSEPTSGPADEVVQEIKSLGGKAVASYGDVSSWQDSENLIKACVDNFGRLDILANMAGILRDRMIFNMTEDEWDAVIRVHLKGTFNCTRHACVIMRQQRGGRIINTTSPAWIVTTGHINYGAAKSGIVSLTKGVAREMGRYGVTCNAIAPAAATRMTMDPAVAAALQLRAERGVAREDTAGNSAAAALAQMDPGAVAPIVVYLGSDQAANINGEVFGAVGGRLSLYSHPVEMRMIYKDPQEGVWTLDELETLVPASLTSGLANPAPPQPPSEKK